MKKRVLTLLAITIMLLTVIVSGISDATYHKQLNTTNDLGVEPLFQHRDTPMLCLGTSRYDPPRYCSLYGEHAWDAVHEVESSSDVASCDHCKKYCGFASIAMINHYYGGNLRQDRIAYHVNTSPDMMGPYWDHPEEDLIHVGLGTGSEATKTLSWALNNAEIYYYEGKPSLDQMKEWIDQNRPILTALPGHFVVTVGYDGQFIHLNDPWIGTEDRRLYDELVIACVWVPPADATARNNEPGAWDDDDEDGLCNFDEINRFFTDPYNNDTDNDGILDKTEIKSYTFIGDVFDEEDIRLPDSDEDGLRAELDWDSDNGGCPDGLEDLNKDGRLDPGETDPYDPSDDPPYIVHDIAITNIEPYRTVISNNTVTMINVTAENQGNTMETFNVTMYYNETVIETKTVTELHPGSSATLTFQWNTTGIPLGNYTLKAEASTVPGETNIEDNVFIFENITISITGDVNADGKVNIVDLYQVAKAFQTKPGQEKWNSNADLNEDRLINISDLFIISKNYGKTT